jgi:hypothetical protein
MTIKAIPTSYRGVNYRSRLEAKWAAFFTIIGWRFIYEPFDGGGYIPDFLITGPSPLLVEIKPAVIRAKYEAPINKIESGLKDTWMHDILILGADPTPRWPEESWPDNPIAGILGEFYTDRHVWADRGWSFAAACWLCCGYCGTFGVYHQDQSYAGRPCGHYDGDSFIGPVYSSVLESHWADAGNDVKWRSG